MPTSRRWWTISLIGLGMLTSFCHADETKTAPEPQATPTFDDASLEYFEKQVRPILTARCFECHGTGQGDPKGGLSLTSRAATLKGGDTGPAVVPGKIKDSLLVSAIEYGDLYQMPPKSKLPAAEIAILTKWVEMGAPWPKEEASAGTVKPFDLASRKSEHWCWQPITNPAPPNVADNHWPISTADRFILAALEASKLTPAPPAEKQALLRRVYFDLVGLPPTPEELAAFLNDSSPQAFEHVVDRLLNSVHFGERWGRHWLDLVRYAETRGHEFEPIIPNAWQYRDYVIRALNADVPYDQLLTEHLAGDLIKPRYRISDDPKAAKINEAVLGTGFWFLGEEVHSPVDIRKDETDRMDNRLDVMSKTFLGLTVACARCHDHKFDAISQRDYYALTGYLISGSYRQVRVQTAEQERQVAEQLAESRKNTRQQLAQSMLQAARPTLDKLDQYLLVAKQAVDGGLTVESSDSVGREIVFADFESDSYGAWKAEGTAFGSRPPRKADNTYEAPLDGFQGERLVNSHHNPSEGINSAATRDAQVGRLVSPPFTIDHGLIRFQVGGGAHAAKTCVNLEVDGKVVRTATGQNSGTLRTEQWQVADLRGKTARIEIVDSETGGWGHILVDQIVFADEPSRTVPAKPLAEPVRQKLEQLAGEKNLDIEILGRWCRELLIAKSEKQHPFHSLMSGGNGVASVTPPEIPATALVVDFNAPQHSDLIQDGVSFGLRPVRTGELQFTASGQPELKVPTIGAWERDQFWKDLKLAPGTEDDHGTMGAWHRHGRMVRTPEFKFANKRLWYLVRGSVRAYAVVNSHLIVAGPLHGSLLREYKHADAQWHWVPHDLDLYTGHRVHVEFTPVDDADCAIAMVVQSDAAPALPNMVIDQPAGSALNQAQYHKARFADLFANFAKWQGSEAEAPTTADALLAAWIVQKRDLFAKRENFIAQERQIASLYDTYKQLAKTVEWESQLAPAMLDGNGIDELLLIRGNSNTPRDPVHRRFLEALGAPGVDKSDAGSGRLELAQQIIQSPLAARVAVNRVWHHLFGRGIVPSVDNMGVLGQAPTHPELLDHLATKFMEDGWSTKRLIKSLVLSRTYQMSSHPTEPAETSDPNNLLWHRMPIKRLQGEVIRDSLLAVSGRLNRTPFGPSVPIHLTPFMEGRGRPGVSGPLDGNGRRSIYIAVRRNFLSPMMLAFDTPSPFSTVGRRTTSNVPAQALILMNDPLVIEMAKGWANELLKKSDQSIEQRIDSMYLQAFARTASPTEKAEAIAFLNAQGARLELPESQRQTSPQSWADLCHVMFNVKEFVFIE